MNEWITSDLLLFVITNVQDRANVQTVVTKTGAVYKAYNFTDHPTEPAGSVAIDEIDLPSNDIISALDKEHVITIHSPVSVNITWVYEKTGRVPVGTIDEIKIRDQNGRVFILTSDGADYPTSLLLKMT